MSLSITIGVLQLDVDGEPIKLSLLSEELAKKSSLLDSKSRAWRLETVSKIIFD